MEVKEAVKSAINIARDLYEGEKLGNLLLEEIEFVDSLDEWQITLGFDTSRTITKKKGFDLFGETTIESERVYKIFHIDANDGHLKKMAIRD